jgi:hypothetical protein
MSFPEDNSSRRSFISQVAGIGAVAAFGAAETSAAAEWNMSWVEQVRKAKHRAVFDAPMPGSVLDLAARYYDNIQKVYGQSSGRVCMILNLRTRAAFMGLADPMWQKYPVGEDAKVNDPDTNGPSRRNLDVRISPEKTAIGYGSIERLQQQGAIVLVCDFALGHLANRLAKAAGAQGNAVHSELRSNLVSGAVLVPSGIFGAAEAQNAGCAFIPA